MVRRLIVISLAVFIFFSSPDIASAAENPVAPLYTMEEGIAQQILAATLRITMIAKEQSSVEPAYIVSNGLATVVRDGDATYIVTHDHWSRLANKVRMVRFESAEGQLLLEMTPSRFYSLIRYRDGGTMVMAVPPELPESVAPMDVAGKAQALAQDQALAIVYWQPEAEQQVSVEPVTVQAIEEHDGNASFLMQSRNGRIVENGNSGGGIFAGTKLVGNMWQTMRATDNESGQQFSTDLSRAARYTYQDGQQDELAADFSVAPVRGGEF
jgi:hypothetical protein